MEFIEIIGYFIISIIIAIFTCVKIIRKRKLFVTKEIDKEVGKFITKIGEMFKDDNDEEKLKVVLNYLEKISIQEKIPYDGVYLKIFMEKIIEFAKTTGKEN